MENFANVFARVLDCMGNEVKEIVLPDGKKIPLTFNDGHYVISAETAWVNDVATLPGYSLRCTGLSFNYKTRKRELCNAELTPYCLNKHYYSVLFRILTMLGTHIFLIFHFVRLVLIQKKGVPNGQLLTKQS